VTTICGIIGIVVVVFFHQVLTNNVTPDAIIAVDYWKPLFNHLAILQIYATQSRVVYQLQPVVFLSI
jgi:hypothetical protein